MTDHNTSLRRYRALLAQNFVVVYAFYLGPVAVLKLLYLAPAGVPRVAVQVGPIDLAIYAAIYALGSALIAVTVAALSFWGGASPVRPSRLLAVAVSSFALGLVFGVATYLLGRIT